MRSETRRTNARGAIAIQFAMLAFGFFAIAAVVIDVRLASLTQQQMQCASDFAALEGLAERDRFGGSSVRTAARDTVRRAFDDDLVPTNGDPSHYGAGPVITLTGGQPGSNGSALITVSPSFVFDPNPELNNGNARSGDIVIGRYDANDPTHFEAADYTRTDFVPTSLAGADSLLVRLRRTANSTGLDRVAGVSSSGPPLPFLFGLGSTMHRVAGSTYNPRTDGLSVSSTSIASARRAVQVSGPSPSPNFAALQVFVLFSAGPGVPGFGTFPTPPGFPAGSPAFINLWDALAVNGSVTAIVRADGFLERVVGAVGSGQAVGYFSRVLGTQDSPLTRVGQVADRMPFPMPYFSETFVPIARSVSGAMKVIGFGRVRVQDVTPSGGGLQRILIQKMTGGIRFGEANAVSALALADLSADPALVAAHASFSDPVSAPVLVR